MIFKRFILFLFILPLTIFLDFILFSLIKTCPSCESFTKFIAQEGAISFPLVTDFSNWLNQLITSFQNANKK